MSTSDKATRDSANRATADGGGVRGVLNRRPVVTAAVSIMLVCAALGMVFWPGTATGEGAGFYTIDDGASFFEARPPQLPPFQHDGAEAVQAVLFRTEGSEPFVGYLQKFSPEGKQAIEELRKKGRKAGPVGLLLKRPGDKQWIAADDPKNAAEIAAIRHVKSPDGAPVFMVVE